MRDMHKLVISNPDIIFLANLSWFQGSLDYI